MQESMTPSPRWPQIIACLQGVMHFADLFWNRESGTRQQGSRLALAGNRQPRWFSRPPSSGRASSPVPMPAEGDAVRVIDRHRAPRLREVERGHGVSLSTAPALGRGRGSRRGDGVARHGLRHRGCSHKGIRRRSSWPCDRLISVRASMAWRWRCRRCSAWIPHRGYSMPGASISRQGSPRRATPLRSRCGRDPSRSARPTR